MNLFLIFLVTTLIQFVIALEMNFVNPIIPYLASYFGIQESSVIYLNLGFSITGLLVPFAGLAADKYGKKKSIIFSILCFILGTLINGLANSSLLFAIGRTLIGLANFSLSASILSYVSDYMPYSKRGRAAGILRIAFAAAIIVSPTYGTYMTKLPGLKFLYLPLTAISVVILILLFKLPESEKVVQGDEKKNDLAEIVSVLKNPITIRFLAVQFFLMSGPVLLFNYLSIWLSNSFLLNQDSIGYVYTLISVGTVSGIIISTILSDKVGKVRFARIGFTLMVLALFPIPYFGALYLVIIFAVLFTLGLDGGWSAYQAIASEIYPNNRTLFMTLISFVSSATILIFTVIGPSLYNYGGFKLVMGISAVSTAISLAVFINTIRDKSFKEKFDI